MSVSKQYKNKRWRIPSMLLPSSPVWTPSAECMFMKPHKVHFWTHHSWSVWMQHQGAYTSGCVNLRSSSHFRWKVYARDQNTRRPEFLASAFGTLVIAPCYANFYIWYKSAELRKTKAWSKICSISTAVTCHTKPLPTIDGAQMLVNK